ncbi:hypothetical protein ABE28_022115 [Peribacillus muralis]|uniref:Uncharacterized protein n=1 Tax=Peribacillus muralis TaxID=264697 RepID=A0A1B3XV03_9BACI|nr:DUF6516 family protein [Peribacillus muralis]AOH57050.1 hypothetical protein ABE28_022115 [Peribacillus muralis]
MENKHISIDKLLLPADIPDIMERYRDIITHYDSIPGSDHIYPEYKRTRKLLSVLFPLREHPVHGKTGLHAIERYDDEDHVRKYSYQWKLIIPRMSKKGYHISAWGNDPHDHEDTPLEFIVKSEPHHHHHVPGDWSKRQDNWNVWALEEALEFVAQYIRSGQEYKP